MSRAQEAGRFLRTVRHLPPSSVLHRLRLRAQRVLYGIHLPTTERVFSAPAPAAAGWPAYEPLEMELEGRGHPSPEENLHGRFEFLNQRHELGVPIDWNPSGVSQLWRYHLHYFDWAWGLVGHANRKWARETYHWLYESWASANPAGQWDAWSPYVVSLRAWTMCAVHEELVAGAPWERVHVTHLARHARYLRANLEFDVGGNHLMKNLKALIGLGAFLRDDALLRFGFRHLCRQVAVQVLPDGGHFERSPSYHAQVLGDLLDVAGLARATGVRLAELEPLDVAVQAMQDWLAVMRMPDGAVPLLNDCLPVEGRDLDALGITTRPDTTAALLLPQSGYAVIANGRSPWHVVLDVGPPCPPELPAHAHADALGVVCHLDGEPVLVDTGTSTYAGDLARRQYERSTAAHNTVVVGGDDSTEVYGAFRAGRRHRVTLEALTEHGVTASHDGYRHLARGPVHRRQVRLDECNLVIEDSVRRAEGHDCSAFFHFAPGLHPRQVATEIVEAGRVRFEFDSDRPVDIDVIEPGASPMGLVGLGWGALEPSACVVVSFGGGDAARLRTRIGTSS